MPRHVVVDGSNLATEGRSMPSLKQLVEAVAAFMDEHPTDLITVVVDATFGHRIDPREVAEFDAAIEHNELVAPPAGAVGRGDAFVLAIANKVNATIISNDSYQEFHGEHDWLFDEGRLIGGKPVPHVGWVFVPRVPVRGPLSRKVTRDAKRKDRPERPAAPVRSSREASLPMPVPSAPPPGARGPGRGGSRRGRADAAAPAEVEPTNTRPAAAAKPAAAPASKSTHVPTPAKSAMVNDTLPFLNFVEHHPVGSVVEGVVETYASHGAYVTIGEARGYVPLRLMSDPPPRSAREAMKLGDTVTLHVAAFHASRRGIDLSTPEMAGSIAPTQAEADDEAADQPSVSDSARKRRGKARPPRAAAEGATDAAAATSEASSPVEAAEPAAAPAPAPAKRTRKPAAAPAAPVEPAPVEAPAATPAAAPAPARAAKRPRKAAAAAEVPTPAPEASAAPTPAAAPAKRARKAAAAAEVPAAPAPPAKKAAKKAAKATARPAKAAAVEPAPSPAPAPAKKAAARKKAAPAGS